MSLLTLDHIRKRIREHEPARYELRATTRQAAVAAILRERNGHTEALFILRSIKDGDPWSGHMAFPGGHLDPEDVTLRDAAERETLEEIGLDLTNHGEFLGEIDQVRANPRGRDIDMVVTPFVYSLAQDPGELVPNYEVADILWGSLHDMYTGDALTTGAFMVQG
ncbi:MAG: CoA pyrophosphatase, partial [Pseudomonadales bacterium]|nr:CoA pyrophosphatase [Pseudomonadales bacterium]